MSALQAGGADALVSHPANLEVFMAGLVLAVGGLGLVPLAKAVARRLWPERIVFFARWRFLHLVQALFVFVLGAFVVGALLQRLVAEPGVLHELMATVLIMGVVALLAVVQARRLDPDGAASLGLRSRGSLRAAAIGLSSYLLLLPSLAGVALAWPYVWERLGGEYALQDVAQGIAETRPEDLWAVALLAVVAIPFLEELLFRGFLQPLLVQNLGDRGGVAMTAFVFATLHGGAAFLPIFALALILGGLMLRTQRLAAVFAVHALHNGLMILMLLAVKQSGGFDAPPAAVLGAAVRSFKAAFPAAFIELGRALLAGCS